MFKKYFIENPFKKMFPGTKAYGIEKDENGIPLINYKKLGKNYNPAAIALYALSLYNKFINKKKKQIQKNFLKNVDWLVSNFSIKEDFGVWYYNFRWCAPGYVCKPP